MATKADKFADAEYGQLMRNDSEQYNGDPRTRVVGRKPSSRVRRHDIVIVCILAVVFVLLVCCIALSIALANAKLPPKYGVCSTPQCLRDAARIRSSMDDRHNPCDNFYDFACGGWMRANPAPADKNEWTVMHVMSDRTHRYARAMLEQPVRNASRDSAERKLKDFYYSCVYNRNKRQSMSVMMNYLSQIVQWKHPEETISK